MTTTTEIEIGPYEIGEIDRPFTYTFLENDGSVANLTGFNSAWFDYWDPSTNAATGAAAMSDAPNGQAQWNWAAGMTEEVGEYRGVLWVTDGTARLASPTFRWRVVNGPGPSS